MSWRPLCEVLELALNALGRIGERRRLLPAVDAFDRHKVR